MTGRGWKREKSLFRKQFYGPWHMKGTRHEDKRVVLDQSPDIQGMILRVPGFHLENHIVFGHPQFLCYATERGGFRRAIKPYAPGKN